MTLITNISPPIDSRHGGGGHYTPVAAVAESTPTQQMNSLKANVRDALEKFGGSMVLGDFGGAADHLRDAQLFLNMMAGRPGESAGAGTPPPTDKYAGYSLNAFLDGTDRADDPLLGQYAGYDLNNPEGK